MGNGESKSGGRTAEGWLIKYGQPSVPMTLPSGRQVVEVILAGAFTDSVNAINRGEAAIECNIEHSKDNAIMRLGTTAVNVAVENRAEGVYGTIQFIDDTVSNDIFERVKAKLVTGLSVQFTIPAGIEPAYEAIGATYLRKLSKLNLTGFAVTAAPFYPDAQIVKATDGAVFARSVSAAEVTSIASDIERIEAERQQTHYRNQGFLLGIRP